MKILFLWAIIEQFKAADSHPLLDVITNEWVSFPLLDVKVM